MFLDIKKLFHVQRKIASGFAIALSGNPLLEELAIEISAIRQALWDASFFVMIAITRGQEIIRAERQLLRQKQARVEHFIDLRGPFTLEIQIYERQFFLKIYNIFRADRFGEAHVAKRSLNVRWHLSIHVLKASPVRIK